MKQIAKILLKLKLKWICVRNICSTEVDWKPPYFSGTSQGRENSIWNLNKKSEVEGQEGKKHLLCISHVHKEEIKKSHKHSIAANYIVVLWK